MSRDWISGGNLYFCHQCVRTVSIPTSPSPSPSSDLLCPNCNSGCIEEYESPNPNSTPPFLSDSHNLSGFPSFPAGFPFVFSSSSAGATPTDPTDLSALFGGPGTRSTTLQSPDDFNPFAFLQNYLNTLRAGGANVQFVIENNNSDDAGFRLPANLGDYFIGPGLEQLIQQLAENDPNRYGTPPASKSAVQGLPNVKITHDLLASDSSQCAVCKDTFELGDEAKQLPCKHIYHPDCILPWLEMHNSCPVCRYELPTDDPDYENRARDISVPVNPASEGGGPNQENPDTPRTIERRLRISLPWPFRAMGSPAETSNSGAGNSGGNNTGGSNPGAQAREEDLD